MVFTNAAGGINLALERGALVLISDHINLQGIESAGGRRTTTRWARASPTCREAYSRALSRDRASRRRRARHPAARRRVRGACSGPSYETPAEIRYLRTIGADLVGMSTVPEVIVANHMGMKVLGDLLRDQHGGGHSAAEDQSRGSAGDRRAWCATRWCSC